MSDYRALLLTDVVDSTKLSERLGNEAMAQVWAAHDRVARDLLRERGGREIDKTDGMLLMFDYAADAVDYALAYHRALAALPVPLRARAGLHVGPVILRENSAEDVARGAKPLEVEGLAKPTAARVMAVARGGQLLLTAEAREALGKTKLRVVCHGHWLMRGLSEPIELFEAGEYESEFAPPVDGDKARRVVRSGERWVAIDELPSNLPQQSTSFIGRERELREVKELLGSARLLTLLGMGGLGKTRLSLQVAAEVRHQFPDGAWFIDLAPVRDEALVVSETAQALGVREEPDRPLLQTICAFLRTRQLLLILDNCEHLLRASANLANAILRAAPQVRILASSRESLHVPGEQAYPLLPLPVPGRGDRFEVLAQSTAVRLFVERARQQKPAFEFTEREGPAIAELVARLEGIPLALELAAARVRSLSVADINTRLKDRYKLLTGGGKVLLERQQTLRALVDWSYDLLNEQEQTLLRRLAVFAGGFDLTAVEQVCGAEPLASEDVLDLLGSLVEKSLVMLDDSGEATRYRMLETIRDYAREKLDQAGEVADAVHRHAAYFFGVAKAVREGMQGAEQARWLAVGESELDNLRMAIAGPLKSGTDVILGLKVAVALQTFWVLRGYVSEARDIARSALELEVVRGSEAAHSNVLYFGAALACAQSDHVEAQRMLETCLEVRRRLGDPANIAGALSTLSVVRLQAGDADGAERDEREALALFHQAGLRVGEAISRLHLAQIAVFRGADEKAGRELDACLRLARELGHREVEAECELVFGEIAFEADNLSEAVNRFTRSREICRDAADRRGQMRATAWLGRVELERGEVSTAVTRLVEAVRAFRAFEMREELLTGLEDLAVAAQREGEVELALRLAGFADASRERLALVRSPRQLARWRRRLSAMQASAASNEVFDRAWQHGRDGDADALIDSVQRAQLAASG